MFHLIESIMVYGRGSETAMISLIKEDFTLPVPISVIHK